MKIMSRDFTRIEKALIIVLVLALVGLVYYQFVDKSVRASIAASEADAEEYRIELEGVNQEIARLQGIQSELDALKADENLTWMGSYNNSEEELKFLNDILANTLQYSISFANVTRSGDQIRRSFSLQYVAVSYMEAQEIVTKLIEGKNRCLVGDMRCVINSNGTVTMTQSATFYETMVGGEVDAALPADSAATNS